MNDPTQVENIEYFHNMSKKITLNLIFLGQVHFFDQNEKTCFENVDGGVFNVL